MRLTLIDVDQKTRREGTRQMFTRGGSAPRSNPLPFYIPFFTKRYPFCIPSIDKWYPFQIPCLELCILLTAVNSLFNPFAPGDFATSHRRVISAHQFYSWYFWWRELPLFTLELKMTLSCDHVTNLVKYYLIERLRFTFTPNGKREFVPRDQVFSLFFVYCLLLLHKIK